jgi:hypothetical protein
MTAKQNNYVYWGCTVVFCAVMCMSGFFSILGGPDVAEMMNHLGYPMYFNKLLGACKLLGAVTLLANRPKRMKEWAYAGFTFDLIFASASLLLSGDPLTHALAPLGFMLVLMGSYFTWHQREAKTSASDLRRANAA